ncbi:vWA domain-containing protein [Flavivirga spongiicola]|uniref:VWA domain-containing protein n=1 Tax=Flavivirga spongiicola TaxID=421621 RepID=A0ABU7XUJ2_9FLAO|nr:VWA domain-containing protein [Flavivirga sp. MEBiC05379]MDO5979247.1 VWA domain-containing protein [Flavivirga sp. MEBiC05379]
MRKIYFLTILATTLFACSSDDSNNSSPEQAFENLNDVTTTSLETTIPRLEISQSNNKLVALLSVTDQDGIPLEQFTLGNYEIKITANDGDPVAIDQNQTTLSELNNTNTNPLAMATTMDYSGSMSNINIQDMEAALKNFISLKDDADLMSVIKFASSIKEVQGFTSDTSLLETAISTNANIGSLTAFYSACDLGLEEVNKLSDVLPVVIGFTDGFDNRSTISLNNLILKSKSLSIPIYTVGFGNTDQFGLEFLANETGGRFFYAPTSEDISNLYEIINQQLRKLYILEWAINYPSGTVLTIEITTNYTAANGSFTDVSTKTITIQ